MIRRLAVLLLVFGTIGASLATAGSATSRIPTSSSPTKLSAVSTWRNCGWTTCTDYMTKSETKAVWRRLSSRSDLINAVMTRTCVASSILVGTIGLIASPLASFVAGAVNTLGCYAATTRLASQIRTIQRAGTTGGCYQISFLRYGSNNPFFATGWNVTYASGWCRS